MTSLPTDTEHDRRESQLQNNKNVILWTGMNLIFNGFWVILIILLEALQLHHVGQHTVRFSLIIQICDTNMDTGHLRLPRGILQ